MLKDIVENTSSLQNMTVIEKYMEEYIKSNQLSNHPSSDEDSIDV